MLNDDMYDVSEQGSKISAIVSNAKYQNEDYDLLYDKQFMYQDKEVGLKHPSLPNYIRFADNGNIEICSKNSAGLIINGEKKTANMIAETINLCSPVIMTHTKPGGLILNNYSFNSRLYQLTPQFNTSKKTGVYDDLYLKCSVRFWNPGGRHESPHWDRKEIELKPFFKVYTDTEYNKLLSELDIPY